MTITKLRDLEYESTNLTDDTTPLWNENASYAIDTTRRLEKKLYKSNTSLKQLCEYVYDNTDLTKPYEITIVSTGEEVTDNTAVPCRQDITVVYEVDNGKYYLYNKTDGNIDFTVENPNDPSNFEITEDYRHLIYNPKNSPLIWEDLGYTNKYKCLDKSLSSQTTHDGDIEMSFILHKVDEIHLLNIFGTSVNVKVTSENEVIYNESTTLRSKDGGTFYNWVFNPFVYRNKISINLPISFEVKIDIKIVAQENVAEIGLLGIGRSEFVGATLYGASLGMLDFSKKKVSDKGELYLKQGNYKATNNLTIEIPVGLTDSVYQTLIDYRAVPVIFRSGVYDSLTIFGIYNKFNIAVTNPSISRMSIDLEALI